MLSGCSSEAQRTRHASRLQELNIFECGKMGLITIASRKPDSIHVREQEFYHLMPHWSASNSSTHLNELLDTKVVCIFQPEYF